MNPTVPNKRSNSTSSGSKLGGQRSLKTRVKTAKGRRVSSTRWLERQLNDPYVAAAKRAGYRSRAAFKLLELDDRFHFLKKGARVLDLGAAPGGWSQVAVERVGDAASVIAVDILEMEPIPGAKCIVLDFMGPDAPGRIKAELGAPVDLVLSDMAAAATGHRQTDHLRVVALCEAAIDFSLEVLHPGGCFIAKVFQGGTEGDLLNTLKSRFTNVRHAKPKASRQESPELYVIASGFKGANG
jgi:23S rRNA (uridine2552-2'-O)-methyltransferase